MFRFQFLYCVTRRATSLPKINKLSFPNIQNSFFCSNQITATAKEDETKVFEVPEVVPNKNHKSVPPLNSLEPGSADKFNLSEYGSALLPSYNFAAYADKSPLLQEFIKLGVELYKLEKDPKVGEFLLTLSFEKDVKPYLLFLKDIGVSPDKFGFIITKNPFLFKEDLDDLFVRINYLQSKKFSKEVIPVIIEKYPKWLSLPVKVVDKRLGYLQSLFKLKGDDVRTMVSKSPAIVNIPKIKLSTVYFVLKEDLECTDEAIKSMCVQYPRILKRDGYEIVDLFDYLTKEMNVNRSLVEKQAYVFSCRKFIIRGRHKFLQSLGRAQYNPKLPGYVSLIELIKTNDEEFCSQIAKTDPALFSDFLKTL